jgi:opacity protein-like surface antigen
MARRTVAALVTLTALVAPTPAFADTEEDALRERDDRIEELERKVDLLAGELSRVRSELVVPAEPTLESNYGFGPAASKIYGADRGLSIGGYGELNYTNFINDDDAAGDTLPGGTFSDSKLDRADALRLVLYLGYKFTDSIIFNSEIEFEHAFISDSGTKSADSGEVAIEFATLDFLWTDWANGRAGLMLLPMGFINEVHEPPFFLGVHRPETERRILPATWREMGAGVFGRIGEDFEYRAYGVTGFNAAGFSSSGIRGGRQSGNRSVAEDFAFVSRMDWTPLDGLLLGGSAYVGNSGQDQTSSSTGLDLPDARLTIGELHAQWRRGRLQTRGVFAYSHLSDADDLNVALGKSPTAAVANDMLGGYVELGYDLWSLFFDGGEKSLVPFARVEYVDTQYDVPSGYTADRNKAFWLYTAGIDFKPTPNVVLKLEYRNFDPRRGDMPDELSLGMGFAF